MLAGFIIAFALTLLAISTGVIAHLAVSGQHSVGVAHAAQVERPFSAHVNIVLNQPGMQQDWPAYSPTTLVVPANSLVTITLHDGDLGDTAMPKDTPFAGVQGTVGGVAYLNGRPYSSLPPDKIAHTCTSMCPCPAHVMRNEITASEQRNRDSLRWRTSHLCHTERVDRP